MEKLNNTYDYSQQWQEIAAGPAPENNDSAENIEGETISFDSLKNQVERGADINDLLGRLNLRDKRLNYYALLDMGADEESLKNSVMSELQQEITVDDAEVAEYERQRIDHIGKKRYGTWEKCGYEELLGKIDEKYPYRKFMTDNKECSFIFLNEAEKNHAQHAIIAVKDGKYLDSRGALQESDDDFLRYFRGQLSQLEEDSGYYDYSLAAISRAFPKLGHSESESYGGYELNGKKIEGILAQSKLSERIQSIDDHLMLKDIKARVDGDEPLEKEDYDFIWDTERLKKFLPHRPFSGGDMILENELQKSASIKDCLDAGVNPLNLAESLFNKQPHVLAYNLRRFRNAGVEAGALGQTEGIPIDALFSKLLHKNYLKRHDNYRPITDNLDGFELYGLKREDILARIKEYRSNLNSSYIGNAIKNDMRYQSTAPANRLRIENWYALQKRDESFYPFTIIYQGEAAQ